MKQDSWDKKLASVAHWLIVLFLGFSFAASIFWPVLFVPGALFGALLLRAMFYEARHDAPAPGDSKFY